MKKIIYLAHVLLSILFGANLEEFDSDLALVEFLYSSHAAIEMKEVTKYRAINNYSQAIKMQKIEKGLEQYRKKPLETLEVSVNGTKNLLELCKKNKSKLIFFSSSEIYGDPDPKNIPIQESYRGNVSSLGPRACYDESKRLGETLCYVYKHYFNIHTNIIRPFNIYGPGMQEIDYRVMPNFASNIKSSQNLKLYGSAKQTRTYCYVTDAIEGFIRVICLGKSGEAYNIGNNKPEVSVKNIYQVLKKIYKGKVNAVTVSHPKSYPNDEPQRRCPDLNKSIKHLGYIPKIKLTVGLQKYLDWAKVYYKY